MIQTQMTLGEFLDKWLDGVRISVKYSTYISYKGYIDNHIKRLIGHIVLEELKPMIIQEYVNSLVVEQRLSARTIGIIITMLGRVFSDAEDYEVITRNPCRKIRLPKVDEDEVEVLTRAEQTKLEKIIVNSGDNRAYGIMLTLYTGLRVGELCGLRWSDISLATKSLKIKASLNREASDATCKKKTKMKLSDPKTKKSKRIIELPSFIADLLKRLKCESNSDYVFSMKNGKFVDPRTMQFLFKKLLEKAGVSPKKFHALRHTFATRAAEQGADPKTVSETLGHSNTNITLNRYTHSLKESKVKMMKGFDQFFKDKKIATFL